MSDVFTRSRIDGDTLTFERVQDVEPILEQNKRLQNAGKQKGDFRHIGSVPNVILEKWMNELGVPVLQMPKHEFDRFIRKKLNDPEWRHLRTYDGGI